MVAVISGSGLGIFGSSVAALGGVGGSGNAAPGRGNDRIYVNTATGNLIVQVQDERLSARGLDLNLVRTYNSQGLLDDDNGDNWRLGVHQRLYNLTGFANTAGSTIIKVFGDGREVTYEYDGAQGAYVSSEGADAHDTLTFDGEEWTWKEGTTLVTETYDADLRLSSARDAAGNIVSYVYDGARLIRIDDASGQRTHFAYDEYNNLTSVRVESDGGNQTLTTYDYDTANRLIGVRVDLTPTIASDARSYVTAYTYDGASHRIASITQTDGTSVEFEYQLIDGQYRVRTYTDAAGRVTTFNYTQPTGTTGAGSGVPASATANASAVSTTRWSLHNLIPSALTQANGSWQPAALLETDTEEASSPSVVFDQFGNGFAVWAQGSDVMARRYIASTATWSSAVVLDSNVNSAYAPTLAVDRETGDAIVAWVQSDGTASSLYARQFSVATGSWGTPGLVEALAGEVSTWSSNLSASIAGGYAAVSWMQNDGTADSVYLSRLVNGSWTSPALLDDTAEVAGWPRVTIDADGNAMVLWRQRASEYRIHSRYWNNTSQSLGAIQLLDDDGDRQPRVAFDAEGNAFAVWSGGTQVRRFDAQTGQWSPQISLQNGTGAAWNADLSVDAHGNALVAWQEEDGAGVSIYARTYNPSIGSWSEATLIETLSESASIDHALSVSVMGDQGVVAWVHHSGDTTNAYAARLSNGVWGPATLLETLDTTIGEISASIDLAGNASVVWLQADESAPSIYRAQYVGPYHVVPNGATWQSVANTLYGVNSVAAGNALQAALGGGSLSAGMRLSGLPPVLLVEAAVQPYYTVRQGDTWAHIASVVYGTTDTNAIAQVRSALGNPTLVQGLELGVPASIQYTTSGSYAAPVNYSAASIVDLVNHNLNAGALTTPTATWNAADLLETGGADAGTPQLAFDAAGNGIAVWAQGNDVMMRRYIASSGTWAPAVILDGSTQDAFSPNVAVDAQTGNAVVTWVQNDGVADSLYVRQYNAASGTWNSAQLLEDSNGAVNMWPLGTSISVVGGHASVAWIQNDGTANSVYLARFVNGAWTAPALLDSTNNEAMHVQVSTDTAGNTTVLWRQFSSEGEYRIHSRRFSATTQSLGSIQLLDAEGDRYPRLALNASGNGFALWGRGAYVRRFDPATGTWGPQLLISNGNEAHGGEIAVDAAGNAIVAWAENDGTAVSMYARRFDAASGTWSAPVLLETSSNPVGDQRIAVSIAGGEALVTWIEDNGVSGDVYAARFSGGSWSAPTLLETRDEWAGELTASVSANGDATVVWLQPDGYAPSIYQAHLSRTPYYAVPSGATWQSIANALYGVDSPEAGAQLAARLGSPALTAGVRLQFLPTTLTVPTLVPAFYLVQSGDTWASITSALYGTSNADAVAALQAQLGNPTLTAGMRLTVPTALQYSSGEGGAGSYLQTEVTANGVTTRYEQDSAGRLVAVTVAPDGLALRTEYEYDADGNVTAIIRDPDGLNRVTRLTYDDRGNLLSQRDDLGNTIERTYDSNNQLLTETSYQGRDPDGAGSATPTLPLTTHHAYDGEQNLRFTVSAAGRVTEHRYDQYGQRTATLTYIVAQYTGSAFDTATLASWAAAQDPTQLQRVDYAYDFRGNLSTLTAFSETDSNGAGTGTASITRFVYDQRGQLLQTVDARGSTSDAGDVNVPYATTYTYDGLGRVLSVSQWNAGGNVSTTLTAYDDVNRATRVTMANGLLTTTLHSLGGEVISTINGTAAAPADLGETTYTYDANGRLRIQTDPTGVRQFFEYDAAGRRIAQIDGDGTLTEFVYDDLGRIVKTIMYSTRVDGATLASLVDNDQRTSVGLATIRAAADNTPADDRITRNVYDAAGRLTYEIDAEGSVTHYLYDGAGRLIEQVRYAEPVEIPASVDQVLEGGFTVTPQESDRRTRHFYDADGLRRGTLDGMGYLVEFIYDSAGQLIHQIGYANRTASNLWTEGTFDELRSSAGVDEEEIADPERDIHSRFFYDGQGRRIGLLDSEGYLTQTDYDTDGNVVQTVRYNRALTYTAGTSTFDTLRSAAQGATTRTMSYQYDGAGRVTRETNYEGTITTYTYNSVGQLVCSTRALDTNEARTTATRYDVLGRVTQELSAEGRALITGSMTQAQIDEIWELYGIAYEYDDAGRRISATSRPDNTQTNVTLFYYDNDGRVRFEINQRGERVEYRYNALNQLADEIHYTNRISTSGLNGGLLDETLVETLTSNPNPANDKHLAYTYSLTGKLASVRISKTTDSDEDGLTTYFYNAFGELRLKLERIDATEILQQEYVYDRRGLLTTTFRDNVAGGLNTSESRTYDAFGRLRTLTDQRNVTSSYEYDRLGRELATVDGLGGRRVASYDAFSRVVFTRDAEGNTTNYSYDDATRTTQLTTPTGIVVTTVNNRHGQALTITAADNITEYFYDANGRLIRVSDEYGTLESRTYDRGGRQVTQTDARGTITSFAYDAANRVLTRTVDTAGLVQETSYVYDGQGRITDVTEPNGRHTHTTYDRGGRVSEVAIDPAGLNIRTGYTYDRQDHVVTVTEGLGTANPRRTQYIYDTLGRRTEEIVDPIELGGTLNLRTIYRYDANNNVTRKIDANGNSTWYVYNANNQLTDTVNALGSVTRISYDADGRVTGTRRYATALNAATLAAVDAPTAAQVARPNDALDEVTRSFFDGDGREIYTINAVGTVTQRTFDDNGKVTRERVIASLQLTGTYPEVDDLIDALGSAETTVGTNDQVTWLAYDRRARLVFQVNALGAVTQLSYDANGNVASKTEFATLRSTAQPTDHDSLQSWASANAGNASNRTSRFWYDTLDRVRFALDAEGYLTETRYSDATREIRTFVYATKTTGLTASSTLADLVTAAAALDDSNVDQLTRTVSDVAGRTIRVIDSLGRSEYFGYDAVGNQVSYTSKNASEASDPAHTWTYQYDAAGRRTYEYSPVLALTDANGTISNARIVTRFEYDDLGNLRFRHEGYGTPGVRKTEYRYDLAGRRTFEIVDQGTGINPQTGRLYLNLTTEFRYDAKGNLTRKIATHSTWYVYDAANRLTHAVDALGGVDMYTHDAFGNVTSTRRFATSLDPATLANVDVATAASVALNTSTLDRTSRSYFDRVGQERYTIDALGTVTERTFDVHGQVTRERILAGVQLTGTYSDVAAVTQALGTAATAIATEDRIKWTAYDLRGDAAFTVDGLGGVTRYTYDASGNVTATTQFAHQRSITETTDLTSLRSWADGNANDADDRTTRFWYDSTNRLRFTLDAQGYLTERRYEDAALQEISIVYAGMPTIEQGATLEQVRSAASSAPDQSDNQQTTRHFDAAGRVVQVTNALQRSEYFGYDALGNRTSYTNQKGAYAGDPSYTWNYEYDAAGRMIYERTPAVDYTMVREAGGSGGPLTVDPPVHARLVTYFEYDTRGNLLARHEAYGTDLVRKTEYRYDALGRQVKTIYPQVGVYNPVAGDGLLGNGGAITRTEQSEVGGLYSEVAYDALGNAYRNRDVAGGYSFKVYDALGRVSYEVDAANYVTQYEYDRFGNQTRLTRYANALSTPLPRDTASVTASEITAPNQLRPSTNEDRVIVTGYDKLNRVTSVTQPSVSNYEPGATAGSAGTTFSAGARTETEYNAFGDVVRTRKQLTNTPTYADSYYYYDRLGQKIAEVDPAGFLSRYWYDETGDLERTIEYARPRTGTLDTTTYGTIVTTTRHNALNHEAGYDRETEFGYDKLNRKTSQTQVDVEYSTVSGTTVANDFGNQVTRFEYDALDNQTAVIDHNLAATYTFYDVLGRAIAIAEPERAAGNGSTTLIPYARLLRDAHGNLVQQINYGGGATSIPSDGSLPTAAAAPSATPNRITTFLLDSHGRAIRTRDASGAERFASYDARGKLAKEWQVVTNAGDPATTTDDTSDTLVTIYRYDALGRQTEVIEPQRHTANGLVQVISRAKFNAFGEIYEKGTLDANDPFSGRQEFFDYDQAGRVWRTNSGDGVTKVYLYNMAGQVTAELRSQDVDLRSSAYTSAQQVVTTVAPASLMRTETRYDARGHIIEQRLPTFGTSNGPEQVTTNIQVSTDPAGSDPITLQLTASVLNSAAWFNAPGTNGGQWIYSNRVSLSWPALGDGEVRIVIYYRDKNPNGSVNSNEIQSVTRSGVSTGTTIEWSDSSTSQDGGIYDISQVYVYGADGALLRAMHVETIPPTPVYVHWTGTVGEYITRFEYRPQGSTGDYQTLGVIDLDGDQVGVNVGGLEATTYEYRIRYLRLGDVTPYAESTGTFTLTRTPGGPPADPTYQPGALNVTNTGGYIRWTAPADTSITAQLRYRPSNSSTWVTPPLTATRVGSSFEVDARSALAAQGSYTFEIEYTKGGQIVALTSGSLDSTGTIITRTTDAGPGGEYAHDVFNESIGTPQSQMGSNIGAVISGRERMELDYPSGYGYIRWEDQNVVNLSWADLGSRAVTVTVRYVTADYYTWTGPSDTQGGYFVPQPGYETQRVVNLSSAGGGTTMQWSTDDGAGGGGITQITQVVVRDQNTGQVLLTQDNPIASHGARVFVWPAPTSTAEGPITAVFAYQHGGGAYIELPVDEGSVFSVRADSLPAGVSQYRMTYKVGDRVIAEQIGTLDIQLGSTQNSTVVTVQTNPPPGSTETVGSITPSGGLAPVTGTYGGSSWVNEIRDSWTGQTHWIWNGENIVNVSFPNFSRTTRVVVDYTTQYNSSPPVPYANKVAAAIFSAGQSTGQVRWTDDQQAWDYFDVNTEWFAGGLSSINRVRVYGQDASGQYTVLLADSGSASGVPKLNWSAPSDTSLIPRFYYYDPIAGWTERSVTPGSTLSVNLSGIQPGSYQYKVSYFRPGESTERSYALGSFTTNGYNASNVTQSNYVNDPSWWSLSASSSNVTWTREPTQTGTTIEFRYYNGSSWVTLPYNTTDNRNYSVSFAGFPPGVYQYQLTYRVGTAVPYVTSTGVITTTTQTTPIPPSMSIAPLSNTTWAAAQLTPITRSGDRLSWSYPKQNAADRIEVRYWLMDSPGTVYTVTASGSGSNWYADLLQVPANAGQQAVLWEVDYYRYRSDLGRYETNSYARASGYANMTPTVTSAPATVTINTQNTVYYNASAVVTLDAPTLSSDPDTRHADALNTTVRVGVAHAPNNPDYGYTRDDTYTGPTYDELITTVQWSPLTGGYNRDGEAGSYSYTTGRYLYWSDPPEVVGEITPTFVYRLAGTSAWTSIPVAKVFSDDVRYLGANIDGLGAGTYEYQVRYSREGDDRPFAVRTGRITNPATATGVIDTTMNSIRSADVLAPRTLQSVDRWGNVISTTDAADQSTYYRYNHFDQMTERKLPSVETVTVAANGAATTSTGTPTSKQYYDVLGRLIATQDENGNVTALTLNAAGQVIRETNANETYRTTTFDVFGNKVVEINERGFRTEHTYDTRDLLTQTVQDAGPGPTWVTSDLITTSYRYDEAGRRIAQTDGNSLTTRSWYDLLGNLIKTVTPMGRVTSYEYDYQGNKTRETNAIGDFKLWTYDYHGRLLDHHWLDDTDITGPGVEQTYGYNFAGAITSITSTAGQRLTNVYDEAGHLIESKETGAPIAGSGLQKVLRTSNYEYDVMGRQVHATLHVDQDLEQDARMEYDAAGRLVSMWDRSGGTRISYDAAGNRTRIRSSASAVNNSATYTTFPAPASQISYLQISKDWYSDESAWDVANTDFWYAFDNMNRMTISRGTNASGSLVTGGVGFSYDATGNKHSRSQTDYVYSGGGGLYSRTSLPATSTDIYIYDGANRLTDVIRDNITVEHYEYDKGSRQRSASTSTLEPASDHAGQYYLVTRQQTSQYNDDNLLTSASTQRRSTDPNNSSQFLESTVTYGVDAAGVMRDYTVNAYDRNSNGTPVYTLAYTQEYILGESYLPTILTMTRTAGSHGPENNVTTRKYAQDGTLYSFTDQKESKNNRHYRLNADGQIVASEQDLGPDESRNFFVNGENVGSLTLRRAPQPWDADRISGFAFNVDDGVISGSTVQMPATITAQSGETLRGIARRLWGDADLWYLLAQENGLSDPDAVLTEGTPLRVPNEVVGVRNSSGIFRPYDANAAIGNTSPEQIIPPLPPPSGKKGCGVLGQILLIVVAVVVTYLTATAAAPYFAGLGTVGGAAATGAVAAAAGSVVSQGLGIAIGMQDSFDWKGLAAAAVGGAIGGAFTKGIGIKGIPGEIAQGALNSALNQGVSIALGLQEEFNWTAVAASAVAAPLASRAGKLAAKAVGKLGDSAVEFATTFSKGLVNQAAYAGFMGGKINWVQLGADAFGNALGNEIKDSLTPAAFKPNVDEMHARNEAALLKTAANMKIPELNIADGVLWSPPEPMITSPLDSNPDLLVNLPMPTAQFASDVFVTPHRASPATNVTTRQATQSGPYLEFDSAYVDQQVATHQARKSPAALLGMTNEEYAKFVAKVDQDARSREYFLRHPDAANPFGAVGGWQAGLEKMGEGALYVGAAMLDTLLQPVGQALDLAELGLVALPYNAFSDDTYELTGFSRLNKMAVSGATPSEIWREGLSYSPITGAGVGLFDVGYGIYSGDPVLSLYGATNAAGNLAAIGGGWMPGRMTMPTATMDELVVLNSQAAARMQGLEATLGGDVAVAGAPGARVTIGGVPATEIAGRLTPQEMARLQREAGTEYAQIYLAGTGPNGRGGTYYLIQGTDRAVPVPIHPDVRFINHTHPRVLDDSMVPLRASREDREVLLRLREAGSPQRQSQIVPEQGPPFYFREQ